MRLIYIQYNPLLATSDLKNLKSRLNFSKKMLTDPFHRCSMRNTLKNRRKEGQYAYTICSIQTTEYGLEQLAQIVV